MLSEQIRACIKEIPDFPKPGISFKDISPLLLKPELMKEITQECAKNAKGYKAEAIAGLESRGFLFGPAIAMALGIPFIPIRKSGKLPRKVLKACYTLEYGEACLEIHEEDIKPNVRIVLHDDLLATGGTAQAAIELIERAGAKAVHAQFLVELGFLEGRALLNKKLEVSSLLTY